jgi:hypothetical protein
MYNIIPCFNMEQVLQKNAKVGRISNLEQLERPKINPEEVVTFHKRKTNWRMLLKITNQKLYDLPKIIHQNCNSLRLNWKLRGNQFRTLLKKEIGTMRLL